MRRKDQTWKNNAVLKSTVKFHYFFYSRLSKKLVWATVLVNVGQRGHGNTDQCESV